MKNFVEIDLDSTITSPTRQFGKKKKESLQVQTYHFRFEGRFNFFTIQSVPVNTLEKRLVDNVAS